jgi:hypothetical protein
LHQHWVATENDLGGGGWTAPMVRAVEGLSNPNRGFNLWQNRPSGCGVMGVGVGGSWGALIHFMLGITREEENSVWSQSRFTLEEKERDKQKISAGREWKKY